MYVVTVFYRWIVLNTICSQQIIYEDIKLCSSDKSLDSCQKSVA